MTKREGDILLLQQLVDAAIGQGMIKNGRDAVTLQATLDRVAKNEYPSPPDQSVK